MIPEIEALHSRPAVIRIPSQIDIPVTQRVMRLIDTQAFQRLAKVRQLGLVARVYPGATHSRFEHSLGVYRNGLAFIRRLSQFADFRDRINEEQIEALLVAALLHDIGHWPFCHPMEDLGLPNLPHHEIVAVAMLRSGEIADCIESDWKCKVDLVARIISGSPGKRFRIIIVFHFVGAY